MDPSRLSRRLRHLPVDLRGNDTHLLFDTLAEGTAKILVEVGAQVQFDRGHKPSLHTSPPRHLRSRLVGKGSYIGGLSIGKLDTP